MTTYLSEQDYLKDQIRSNRLAIKKLKELLEIVGYEMPPDFLDTKSKVEEALSSGIENLGENSRELRKRIKILDGLDNKV